MSLPSRDRMRYAFEQLLKAEYALAIGSDDMRSRLYTADQAILPVDPSHLPDDLKDDSEYVIHRLTVHKGKRDKHAEKIYQEDPARLCTGRMKNKTAVKIARRLLKVREELEHYLDP